MIFTFLSFILVIGVIIFVHELGHFLAAKAVGVRVLRFSLGFPPRMIGKQVGDTDYCISWIPFGGYVKMAGIIDESLEGEESIQGHPWEFESKRPWQKALIMVSGVLMNFLLGIVLFCLLTAISGVPEWTTAVIGEVLPGFPAEQAGIRPGDRLLELNGRSVSDWDDVVGVIHELPEGADLQVTWESEGETHSALLKPRREKTLLEGEIRQVAKVGINPEITTRPATLGEILASGPRATWSLIHTSWLTIRLLVSGGASVRDLAGPLFIAQMSGRTARSGILDFIGFIGFISVNIGFLNILPIPVLDGGHLVYIAAEALLRRRIPFSVKLRIQQVGMCLLLLLMVVVFYNDILRIFAQ